MRIVIASASGQLARATAEYALEKVSPDDVILVSWNAGALADFADRGVAVRYGDYDRPESLRPLQHAELHVVVPLLAGELAAELADQPPRTPAPLVGFAP